MDSFQHINNVQYLKYQENARLKFFDEFLKEMNPNEFNIKEFDDGVGIGPILSNSYCNFKSPLSFPDQILIGATIKEGDLSEDRYKLSHGIWSLKNQRLVADGYGTVVCYDFKHSKVLSIPNVMRVAIEKVLSRDSQDIYENMLQISNELQSHPLTNTTQQQQQQQK